MALDIALGADLDLPIGARLIRGRELVAQRVAIRLQQHLGDWVLDTSVGIPWATYLSTKPAPVPAIEASCRAAVAGTPGVVRVETVSVGLVGRTLTIAITYSDQDGEMSVTLSAAPGSRNFAVASHVPPSGAIG